MAIEPNLTILQIIQELPDELQGASSTTGEASLRGHLAGEDGKDGEEEVSATSAYVPPDPKDDVQLNYAFDLLRGIQANSMFPPDPSQGIPN